MHSNAPNSQVAMPPHGSVKNGKLTDVAIQLPKVQNLSLKIAWPSDVFMVFFLQIMDENLRMHTETS